MILVTGKNGQLGSTLQDLLSPKEAIFCDSKEGDITNSDLIKKIIEENEITSIINCAAYTAVDKAESEPELAFKINHKGVENLAKLSNAYNLKLIHISTDYVFDGEKREPYTEEDPTNPINIYGLSKLKGEQAILEYAQNAAIIRTSWLYSRFGNNFVKTMVKLAQTQKEIRVVNDQVGTPTNAADLAGAIANLLHKVEGNEIYHFSNEGETTWYGFAKEIFSREKINVKLIPIGTKDFPASAKRPQFSLLCKNKIKKILSFQIPSWEKSL